MSNKIDAVDTHHVKELFNLGLTVPEVVAETGISQQEVERIWRKKELKDLHKVDFFMQTGL